MPNILLDGDNWADTDYGTPPSYWTGTQYEYLGDDAFGNVAAMSYAGTVSDGDKVAGTITQTGIYTPMFDVSVNGTPVFSQELATGVSYPFSHDLAAGDTVVITLGNSGYVYTSDGVLVPTPEPTPPPPVEACTELGRVTRCYASGYQRTRIHESRLVRGEKRCLVANFNGAFDTSRSITSVTWKCQQPYAAVMSNARVFAREVAVDINAQLPGCSLIKCEATLDNGEVYTQLFRVLVMDAAWFDVDPGATAGPMSLTSP